MKKTTLLLLVASLFPVAVLAWNTPGDDFSGELKLEGPVVSTRNPWVWKVGAGSRYLDAVYSGTSFGGERVISVPVVTNGAIVIHTQRLKSDPGGNLLS